MGDAKGVKGVAGDKRKSTGTDAKKKNINRGE